MTLASLGSREIQPLKTEPLFLHPGHFYFSPYLHFSQLISICSKQYIEASETTMPSENSLLIRTTVFPVSKFCIGFYPWESLRQDSCRVTRETKDGLGLGANTQELGQVWPCRKVTTIKSLNSTINSRI